MTLIPNAPEIAEQQRETVRQTVSVTSASWNSVDADAEKHGGGRDAKITDELTAMDGVHDDSLSDWGVSTTCSAESVAISTMSF